MGYAGLKTAGKHWSSSEVGKGVVVREGRQGTSEQLGHIRDDSRLRFLESRTRLSWQALLRTYQAWLYGGLVLSSAPTWEEVHTRS